MAFVRGLSCATQDIAKDMVVKRQPESSIMEI